MGKLLFCPALTKLALDLHVNFCVCVCVCVCMYVFRSFFEASGSGSGTPLIQLGVLSLAEQSHTQIFSLAEQCHTKNFYLMCFKSNFDAVKNKFGILIE